MTGVEKNGNRIPKTDLDIFIEMRIHQLPPFFGCSSGKMGLLSSMFTNPDTGERELQENFYTEWWKKPEIMAAGMVSYIITTLCNTNCETVSGEDSVSKICPLQL